MKTAGNNQIKLLRKLNKRKYREQYGLFIVEGERGVEQVKTNKYLSIKEVYVAENKWGDYSGLFPNAYLLNDDIFTEIAGTDNPQGVLAVCEIPKMGALSDLEHQKGIILAIDRIQDPGNMGTIMRTANWFGVKALLLEKGTVDIYNPKIVRSTAGAIGAVPIIMGGLHDILTGLEAKDWHCAFLDGNEGAISIKNFNAPEKLILVVGNEAQGVNKNLFNEGRGRLMIPFTENRPTVESLNAAIAVGIALYALS